MNHKEIIQLQALAYIKGSTDVLQALDQACSLIIEQGMAEGLEPFFQDLSRQMRVMQAEILNKFEELGVDVSGAMGW